MLDQRETRSLFSTVQCCGRTLHTSTVPVLKWKNGLLPIIVCKTIPWYQIPVRSVSTVRFVYWYTVPVWIQHDRRTSSVCGCDYEISRVPVPVHKGVATNNSNRSRKLWYRNNGTKVLSQIHELRWSSIDAYLGGSSVLVPVTIVSVSIGHGVVNGFGTAVNLITVREYHTLQRPRDSQQDHHATPEYGEVHFLLVFMLCIKPLSWKTSG